MSVVPGGPTPNQRGNPDIPDKETLCRQWIKGDCELGDRCRFRHEEGGKGKVKNVQKSRKRGRNYVVTANIGSSTTVTDSQAPGSTQKNKEEIVAEKKEGNDAVIDNDSTSEIQMCRDWKRGKCTRGDKCRYKHGTLQLPNVADKPSKLPKSQIPVAKKVIRGTEGFKLQERNSALIQSGDQGNGKEVDVLERLRIAMTDAREAGQRGRLALAEEENRRAEEAMAVERAECEARQREVAFREEGNRRREEAMPKGKQARAKAVKKEGTSKFLREAKEVREAAERERLALGQRKRAMAMAMAMAMEIAAKEAREREITFMEEENQRREEAMAKEKEAAEREARAAAEREMREAAEREAREAAEREARVAAEKEAREAAEREARKEARKAKIQEKALKREARRRETEAKAAQEKAEREVREAAEREARETAEREAREREAREAAEKEAREAAQRKAREAAEREARVAAEKEAREAAEKEARKEARKAKIRENALKREARRRETEAKAAQEKAEREAREAAEREARETAEREAREVAEREARETAEKEAREAAERNARKEAREARIREKALKREAKRRETEAKVAQERAEREAREAAEREARAAAEKKAREAAEREAREVAEREAREAAERDAREAAERKRQQEIAAQREKEAAVVEQYVVSETSLVTCSAGFDIQHVIPGFDLCRIVIKNLPKNAKREEIADIFIQQGIHSSEFFIFQVKEIGRKQEAVILANAEHGEAISLGLDGIEFREEVLSFSVSDNASWNALGTTGQNIPFIIVSWRIPAETIVVNYYSMEEAQRKMRHLDKIMWKGRRINAKMNDRPRHGGFRNFVPESIKLFNCPPGSGIDEEFYQLVESYDIRALNSSVSFDLQESFNVIYQRISGLHGVRINSYRVLKRGDQADGEVKVKVDFDDWEDAKRAHLAIDKQRIGFATPLYQCWLPKQLQYKITIPRQQYESQKKQWNALGERRDVDNPYVQARMGDRGVVFIEIVGKEKERAGPLKVRVENMVAGEKLDPTFWHPSFASPKSKAFFDEIYAATKVFVRGDFKTQSLKIYGEPNAVEEARHVIQRRIESLGQIETTRILDREWVGYFVREGVGKLTELLGEENVRLDVQPRVCRITIKGGEEANHYLQRLIDQARAAVIVDSVLPGVGDEETCPVCYGDLSHPEQLGCGHSYCSGCLKHFLTSVVDNKTFPLICIGNEATCNVPVAIPFIRRFLPVQTFQNLIEAAFHKYLEQHQQELKYCTTPDCKQIYRRRTDKSALQCPACFSTICPSCDEEAHTGMSCEEQRILKNPAEQERLNEQLAAASGYKRCPTCRVMIEKTEGCSHMNCKCGAHICWRCMNVFPTARETYDHLRAAHGGIYEEAPAGVVVEDEWNGDFIAGQVEALGRIERERVAREQRLRHANAAAANPFIRRYHDYHAQLVAEQLRARELAEDEEQARRIRVAAIQHERRTRAAREAEQARQLQEAARAQEEDRGWCILM